MEAAAGAATSQDTRNIRVRYSVIVNYLGKIYRLVTSILTTVIITRSLSVADYGLWVTLVGIMFIVSSIPGLWNIWTLRFYSRKQYIVPRVTMLLTIIYGASSIAITFAFIYYLGLSLSPLLVFIVALTSVAIIFNAYLMSLSVAAAPFIVGKTEIIRATVWMVLVYVFLRMLDMGLFGVLVSNLIGQLSSTTAYVFLLHRYGARLLKPAFRLDIVKLIFIRSYVTVFGFLENILKYVERLIITAATASTLSMGYLGAAYTARTTLQRNTAAFTFALMSKLLRENSPRDIVDVVRISLAINVFTFTVFLVASKPILSILGPDYIRAQILFIMFLIESLILIFADIFATVSMALEKQDMDTTKHLYNTPLFIIPMYRFTRSLSAVLAGSIAMLLLRSYTSDPVIIVAPYPAAWLLSAIPYIYKTHSYAKKYTEIIIPYREIYSASIAAFGVSVYLLINSVHQYVAASVLDGVTYLLFHTAVSLLIYVSILYISSRWYRNFIKTVIQHIVVEANILKQKR